VFQAGLQSRGIPVRIIVLLGPAPRGRAQRSASASSPARRRSAATTLPVARPRRPNPSFRAGSPPWSAAAVSQHQGARRHRLGNDIGQSRRGHRTGETTPVCNSTSAQPDAPTLRRARLRPVKITCSPRPSLAISSSNFARIHPAPRSAPRIPARVPQRRIKSGAGPANPFFWHQPGPRRQGAAAAWRAHAA